MTMSRGRTKKKPNVDTKAELAEMVDQACQLLIEPFDDRKVRDDALPSMNDIAREMGITIIKLKRLLITGGFYSSATSRAVQERVGSGMTMEQICNELNIRPASFFANIPYSKGAYNLNEPSLCADQNERYRKRKKAVELLLEKIEKHEEWHGALWKAICAFQGYTFQTSGRGKTPGKRFKYSVSKEGGAGGRHYDGLSVEGFGNEMIIEGKQKSISRSTVDRALERVLEMNGVVNGPKDLGLPEANSYLFAIFTRFGLITSSSTPDSSTEKK